MFYKAFIKWQFEKNANVPSKCKSAAIKTLSKLFYYVFPLKLIQTLLPRFGQKKQLTAKLSFYCQGSLVLYEDDKHTSGPPLKSNLM